MTLKAQRKSSKKAARNTKRGGNIYICKIYMKRRIYVYIKGLYIQRWGCCLPSRKPEREISTKTKEG